MDYQVLGVEKVIERLGYMSKELQSSYSRALQRITFELQQKVKFGKLSGQVLKNRTGTLRRSINTKVITEGDTIKGQVGTNVVYAAVHELGGTFSIPAHMRRAKSGRMFQVRAYKATYPKRSFLASTLQENKENVFKALQDAAIEGMK